MGLIGIASHLPVGGLTPYMSDVKLSGSDDIASKGSTGTVFRALVVRHYVRSRLESSLI
jgi:hypothetical protein